MVGMVKRVVPAHPAATAPIVRAAVVYMLADDAVTAAVMVQAVDNVVVGGGAVGGAERGVATAADVAVVAGVGLMHLAYCHHAAPH